PDGRKLYVANFGSDSVSVISTKFERVIKTIRNVGAKPRGIAIVGPAHRFSDVKDDIIEFLAELRDLVESRDDESDDNERDGSDAHKDHIDKTKVYVTQFLAQLRNDNRPVD